MYVIVRYDNNKWSPLFKTVCVCVRARLSSGVVVVGCLETSRRRRSNDGFGNGRDQHQERGNQKRGESRVEEKSHVQKAPHQNTKHKTQTQATNGFQSSAALDSETQRPATEILKSQSNVQLQQQLSLR